MGADAGDVDDAALAALAHRRSEFLAGQQGAPDQVEIEIGLPVLQGDVLEGVVRCDRDLRIVAPGGIDQDGRNAQAGLDTLAGLGQAGAGHRIRGKEVRLASPLANGVHPGLAPLRVEVHDGHPGAGLRQPFCDGSAQRAPRPDYHRRFAGQVEKISHRSAIPSPTNIAFTD